MTDKPIARIWYPVADPVQPYIDHQVGSYAVTKIEVAQVAPDREAFLVYVAGELRWQLDIAGAGVEFQRVANPTLVDRHMTP